MACLRPSLATATAWQEILDDVDYAAVYSRLTGDKQRLQSFKAALYARPIDPVPSRPFAHLPSKPDHLNLLSLRRSEDTVIREAGRQTGVAESYLKQFQALVKKPAETIQKQEFALKDLIDWEKVKSCPPFEHPSPSLDDPHSLRG